MGFKNDEDWSKFKRSSKSLLQELGFPSFLFEHRKRWDYVILHEYDYQTKSDINEIDPANLERLKLYYTISRVKKRMETQYF